MNRLLIGCLSILLFMLPGGCVSTTEKKTPPHSELGAFNYGQKQNELVDRRIQSLSALIQRGELSKEDEEIASTLLNTYQKVEALPSGTLTDEEYGEILWAVIEGLSLVDEAFFSAERGRSVESSRIISVFAEKRKRVLNAYRERDSKGVITECLQLQAMCGAGALTPEISLVFALALADQNMLKEAIRVGEGVSREIEGTPDLTVLQAHMAQWHLELGERSRAMRIADHLAHQQREHAALMKNLNKKINKVSEQTDVVMKTDGTVKPVQPTEHSGDTSLEALLEKVNILVRRHAYDEARLLLIKRRIGLEDSPESDLIDKALVHVEQAEESYVKEKTENDALLTETVEAAKRLVAQEKFDEALARIDELGEDQVSAESEELKAKTIESLINRERNRAAEIFLEARKTRDLAKREELLLISHDILKVLIDKYPSSHLHNKLKANIEVVKRELDAIRYMRQE